MISERVTRRSEGLASRESIWCLSYHPQTPHAHSPTSPRRAPRHVCFAAERSNPWFPTPQTASPCSRPRQHSALLTAENRAHAASKDRRSAGMGFLRPTGFCDLQVSFARGITRFSGLRHPMGAIMGCQAKPVLEHLSLMNYVFVGIAERLFEPSYHPLRHVSVVPESD